MKRSPERHRHLDVEAVLDLFEGRSSVRSRQEIESHLAGSCSDCRERVHAIGRLFEIMRSDRTPPVPDWLHERARLVFVPRPAARDAEAPGWRWARLLFDSRVTPLPAATRRAFGETQRLRFALGTHQLDLELDPQPHGTLTVRGRMIAPDPALHRIEIESVSERFEVWPDAEGRYVVEQVPAGALRITVAGPSGRFRLRPIRSVEIA